MRSENQRSAAGCRDQGIAFFAVKADENNVLATLPVGHSHGKEDKIVYCKRLQLAHVAKNTVTFVFCLDQFWNILIKKPIRCKISVYLLEKLSSWVNMKKMQENFSCREAS